MNFLAHLHLAYDDEDLMLGALLGDFVRGIRAMTQFSPGIREGIRLHRKIDKFTDNSPQVKALRKQFPRPFRRYAGIVIDVAFDHELVKSWDTYCDVPIGDFDRMVREVLARHEDQVPQKLKNFMHYADRRGLFANYRHEEEIMLSLSGIGRRLKRDNPLHRVSEIWPELQGEIATAFRSFYPDLQLRVEGLRKRKSTTTGS